MINDYIKLIEQWAIDREIDKKGTPKGQALKTYEEFTELEMGILKNDLELIKDSVGDVFVTLVIGNMITNNENLDYILNDLTIYEDELIINDCLIDIATIKKIILAYPYNLDEIIHSIRLISDIATGYNFTLLECIEQAYNEIAKRKGKIVNGIFVKESDFNK